MNTNQPLGMDDGSLTTPTRTPSRPYGAMPLSARHTINIAPLTGLGVRGSLTGAPGTTSRPYGAVLLSGRHTINIAPLTGLGVVGMPGLVSPNWLLTRRSANYNRECGFYMSFNSQVI